MLIPLRLGEVLRALTLQRWYGVPAALGLGTVVAEKLADLTLFALFSLLLPIVIPLPDWLRSTSIWLVAGGALASALIVAVLTRPTWRATVLKRAPRRARSFVENALAGSSVLWRSDTRRGLWLSTLGVWLVSLVTPVTLAVSAGRPLSLSGAITLLLALQVTFVIPTPPGLVGVVQAVCVLVLSLYGYDATTAFAYGLILNAAMILPLIVSGLAAWLLATRTQQPCLTP
jgi:uncharacterized membrane protein YbhN (UPF0104 family)